MTKNPFNIRNNNNFNELMTHRVHEILLVASPYDAFILEEEGGLTEQIMTCLLYTSPSPRDRG